jgi:hypothetical protein
MARTILEIQQQILTEKANQPALSGLTSVSQTSIFNLWSYVTAVGIYIQETFWDVFKGQLEADIADAPIGTDKWVQTQSYLFQYDAVTPQIITLNNFVPSYAIVDTSKQLITRASVKTLPNRFVSVKVAKQEPPIALTSTELTSFKGFLNEISFAGVQYNAVSYTSDKLLVGATVYYNGQYSATITANTISAINSYLVQLPFDGYIRVSKLEDAIQGVSGVTDVVINNMAIRPDSIPFTGTTYMVKNNNEIYNKYTMYSGYAVGETTSGQTFTDTIVFVAES